ncbi:cytochrome P450 [Penicillium herquei]|nr:cytochrome P450 [Penicillium herquei]
MLTIQGFLTQAVLSGIILLFSRFLWNYLRSPLKSFPGPWQSSFTNIWRLIETYQGRCELTHLDLHRKLGSAIRIGPNILSLSDPSLINQVYTVRDPWLKSDLYNVNDIKTNGMRLKNLFSHQDEKWHSKYLRPVKNLYSMTKVQDVEPAIDVMISSFADKIRERFVQPGKICQMSEYLTFLSWDVMGQVTFSKDLGILEAGYDHQKLLETSVKSLDYFAPICQIPKLDFLLDKNPICRVGPPSFGWATGFSVGQYQTRLTDGTSTKGRVADYMDKFIELKGKHADTVDDNTVTMYMLSNVIAGGDTTANTMCSVIYYVLKHPHVYKKLCDELRSAKLALPAQWKDVVSLPYLDAVMREAMRISPGLAMVIERIVPKGGFSLPDGRFVAEGTIVGMNPYVIHRDSAVYGADVDSFIPERWLPATGESDEVYESRIKKMKGSLLTFGAGPRSCLGRHLAQLEVYKVIATIFTEFDMELPSLDHEWNVTNSWFVRGENIPVTIKEAS